jgi:hypothetical protein
MSNTEKPSWQFETCLRFNKNNINMYIIIKTEEEEEDRTGVVVHSD